MPIRPELRHLYTGPAWQATRTRIRERARDRCERCGRKNGTKGWNSSGVRRILIQCGVAHLDHCRDLSRFYDDDNLSYMCRGCHLKFDQPQHKASRSARKDRSRPLLGPEFPPEAFL